MKKTILFLFSVFCCISLSAQNDDIYDILLNAVLKDDVSELDSLIIDGIELNKVFKDGSTLLHYATISGNYEMIKLLLSKGADINVANSNSQTTLHLAIINNCKYEIIKLLIDNGANINSLDNFYYPPLAYAENNLDVAKLLVENGADVNLKLEGDISSPLSPIFRKLRDDFFTYYGCIENDEKNSVNFQEEKDIYFDLILLCVNKGFNVFQPVSWVDIEPILEDVYIDSTRYTATVEYYFFDSIYPYNYIVRSNKLPDFEKAISDNIISGNYVFNYSDSIISPLHLACYIGNSLDIVESLIENGADVNQADYYGDTPLVYAMVDDTAEDCDSLFLSDIEIIKFLLEKGAKIDVLMELGNYKNEICETMPRLIVDLLSFEPLDNDYYGSCLKEFTFDEKFDILMSAVKGGYNVFQPINVDIHFKTFYSILVDNSYQISMDTLVNVVVNFSPLEKIVNYGKIDVFKDEIIAKINENIYSVSDNDLNNALHIASSVDCPVEIVLALLSKGLEVNSRNIFDKTPLHYACSCKNGLDIVKLLVKNKANVNLQDINGLTPLHFACENINGFEIAKYLIKHGAKIDKKDNLGRTPLDIAQSSGNKELYDFLKKK